MAFQIRCSECGSPLTVVEALIGKSIKCKVCGESVTVTAPRETPSRPVSTKPLADDVEAEPLEDEAEEVIDAVPLDDDEPAPPKRTPTREKARMEIRGAEETAAPRKKSMLPMILAGLVGLLALGGIGAAVAYILNRSNSDTAQDTSNSNPNSTPATTERPPPNRPGNTFIPEDPKPAPVNKPNPTTTPPKADTTTPSTPSGNDDNPFNPKETKSRPEPVQPKPVTPTTPTPPTAVVPDKPAAPTKINPAILAKLKSSTVYLEVDDGRGGGGTGTGWFGGEPGLILTNAHVIGMKQPGSREPAKISVFVESGQFDQQKLFEGPKVKILAVDRSKDLAVLQIVNEKELPPPLPIKPSTGLHELDKLVVLGFPGGRRMAERNGNTNPPVVSLTESTVSAFQNDNNGNRNSIQLQGGIVHGHSGGPVVDSEGNVVGVAVRVDVNHNGQLTTIAEAIPSEYVTGLIAGRTAEVEYGQAYLDGDRVKVPVSIRCSDPLGQLKSVGIGYWIGEKNARPRAPAAMHQAEKGDVNYLEATLKYSKDKQVAIGEIDFPSQTDGRAYWTQPFYSNKLVEKQYVAGNTFTLSTPPVERTPSDLRPKYVQGSKREMTFIQDVQLTEVFENDERRSKTILQQFTANEAVEKPKAPTAFANLVYALTSLSAKSKQGDQENELPKLLAEAVAVSKTTTMAVTVGRAGEPTSTTPASTTAAGADPVKRDALARYGRQLANVLRDGLFMLPGKSVNAGESWKVSQARRLLLDVEDLLGERTGDPRRFHQTQEDLTATYLGRRVRGGRTEVVLKVEGTIRPIEGAAEGSVSGSVKGELVVEDLTGVIIDAKWTRTFDVTTTNDGPRKRVLGTETLTVTRGK
jgi:S1-C subfamily serine protease